MTEDAAPKLSLVIPAYNEDPCLRDTLEKSIAYLAARDYASEIVVVDDGSADGTHGIAQEFKDAAVPVKAVRIEENRGKGFCVRTGMLDHAKGAYRVFYDADASTPIEELEKLWPLFEDGADIVIGSRSIAGSDIQVRQAWYRERMGRILNLKLRFLGITRFRDTQCGFKGFSAAACAVVFTRQTIERFSFDAELLYIAGKHGLRIDEAPIRWLNCPHSRLHPILDSAQMFFDLLKIRVRDFSGRYR